MRRTLVLTVCLLGLAASPALAEDKAGEAADTLDDIVEGVGGFLKVLVGPPVSSPSPYLNLPGQPAAEPVRPAEKPAPPPPVAAPIPAPAPVVIMSPAAQPAPAPSSPPPPPPPVKAAAPVPPPPPPARPAIPAAAPPPPPPAPVTVAEPAQPACALRVAATATIEQMRRLPTCK